MSAITVRDLSKSYTMEDGGTLHVLDDISIELDEHGFYSLLGPSGCGKSTLLRLMANLEQPDTGSISIGGTGDVRTGFVFQSPTLLDWRTVGNNIRIVLKNMGVPEDVHEQRIDDALELVGLSDFKDQYPQSLSGGMQQRVGIARALSIDPEVLLMDEPFGSLDELTARKLRSDLLDIWREEQVTIVFVTHNVNESVYLSDTVYVMSNKPATITETVPIDIPRPRHIDNPEIPSYEKRILSALGVDID